MLCVGHDTNLARVFYLIMYPVPLPFSRASSKARHRSSIASGVWNAGTGLNLICSFPSLSFSAMILSVFLNRPPASFPPKE